MFRHPAWAVGSYNSCPLAAKTVGTKSTGGCYHQELSPCTGSQDNLSSRFLPKSCPLLAWIETIHIMWCRFFFPLQVVHAKSPPTAPPLIAPAARLSPAHVGIPSPPPSLPIRASTRRPREASRPRPVRGRQYVTSPETSRFG